MVLSFIRLSVVFQVNGVLGPLQLSLTVPSHPWRYKVLDVFLPHFRWFWNKLKKTLLALHQYTEANCQSTRNLR
jgi:hypothetical protein